MNKTLSFLLSLLGLITLMGCATMTGQHRPELLHAKGGVNDFLSSVGAFEYGITVDELRKRLSQRPLASYVKGQYDVQEVPWPKKAKQPPVPGPFYLLVYITTAGEEHPLSTMWLSDKGVMKYSANIVGPKEGYLLRLLRGAPVALQYERARESKDQRLFAELYWRNLRSFKAFLQEPHTWSQFQAFMKELKASNPPEAANLWRIKEATWNNTDDLDNNSAFRAQADPDGLIPYVESHADWDKIMAVRLDNGFYNYFWHGQPVHDDSPDTSFKWSMWNIFANIYLDHDRIVAVMMRESAWYDCVPRGEMIGSQFTVPGLAWYNLWGVNLKIWFFPDDEPKGETAQQNSP